MNLSGFASRSSPTTTSRSRFLRNMVAWVSWCTTAMRRATWRSVSQVCLPRLVPLLLEKPVLEARFGQAGQSQAVTDPACAERAVVSAVLLMPLARKAGPLAVG